MIELFENIFNSKTEKKERYQFILMTCFSIFLILAYFVKNNTIFSLGKTVFLTIGAFLSPYCPICLALLCGPFSFQQNIVFSLYQELIIALPIVFTFLINRPKKQQLFFLLACLLAMFVSLMEGCSARVTTFIIHCLFIALCIDVFSW